MAAQTGFGGFDQPTADERTMAMLAHLLMAFSGFIGPVVILCVQKDSRFVKFHALQALIWHAIYLVLLLGGVAVFMVAIFSSVLLHPQSAHTQGPPPTFVYFVPLLWLGFMGGSVVNLILGIAYAIKANRGEWATYPIFGKWLLPEKVADVGGPS